MTDTKPKAASTTQTSTLKPPSEAINVLPSRFTIICLFWSTILFAVPYWWKTTTIERLPLPISEIQEWGKKAVRRSPCYLKPSVSLAFQSTGAKNDKVQDAIHETMAKLNHDERMQCVDLQWSQDAKTATYNIVLTDDDEMLKRKLPANTIIVSTKKDLSRNLLGNSTALLGLGAPLASAAKFSSRYKLVFSLLNEDSSAGDALLSWDAPKLLHRHIRPLTQALKPLHNFTINTEIQYFAPLTIEVTKNEEEEEGGTFIQEDDLKAFINNADWNLPTSLTLEPILHFILYVPKKENRPMRIRTNDGRSPPNGFITPQRGGVVIFNPPAATSPDDAPNLATPFRIFESQLRKLLGVPPTLPGPNFLEEYQIDALVRRRLYEAVKDSVESLKAIEKLVDSTPNMRVGREVQKGVNDALRRLKLAEQTLPTSPSQALSHAAIASSIASRAYFDPSMLALLYFPDEHKYAIYTPLFGPVAVPLVVALVKEWKDRKKRRLEAAKKGEKTTGAEAVHGREKAE